MKMNITIFSSIFIVILLFFVAIHFSYAEQGEYQLLDTLNKARIDKGLTPLIDIEALTYIAQEYAIKMGESRKLSHFLWSVEIFHQELYRYLPRDSSLWKDVRMYYQYLAKLPYTGKFDPQEVIDMFFSSDLHRVGLLSKYGRYVGIGFSISRESDGSETLWICISTGDVYK